MLGREKPPVDGRLVEGRCMPGRAAELESEGREPREGDIDGRDGRDMLREGPLRPIDGLEGARDIPPPRDIPPLRPPPRPR